MLLGLIIMTFLFLLNALTAELRRPSSRQRELNSQPITKQEGVAVTCFVPLHHQIWSLALCYVSVATSPPPLIPKVANCAISHPRVPKYFSRVYNIVKSKKQRCYPRDQTRNLQIMRWLFCPFKELSNLLFDLTL